MAADNELGVEGMVALAPALDKLVALTSLDLSCTWLHIRRLEGFRTYILAQTVFAELGCVRGAGEVMVHNGNNVVVCVRVAVGDGCRERCGC